jgi:DNA-binding MarR family transcriptional regulator
MADSIERLQALQQLGRTYRAFLAAYEKEVGHFLPRWRVMLHLYNYGQPCPQKELGEASRMDPGSLSRQLSALETLGWIKRETSRQDKRVTNVSLTRKGVQEVRGGLPKRAAFIERALGGISEPQLRQLMDALVLLEARFTGVPKPEKADSAA